MPSPLHRVRPSVTSAHAIALAALVLAAGGGGYALADSSTPAPATAYSTHTDHLVVRRSAPSLVLQLPMPTGSYLVQAKLDVKVPVASQVTCAFDSITGGNDTSTISLPAGGSGVISLLGVGQTHVPDLSCTTSAAQKYTVSNAEIVALSLAGMSGPVPTAT